MKTKDIVLIMAMLGLAIVAAFYVLDRQQPHSGDAPQQAATPAPQKQTPRQEARLEKKFEDLLNGFLRDFKARIVAYRQQRSVLDDLFRPSNMKSKDYIDENYRLFAELVPALKAEMNKVMQSFAEAEREIDRALEGMPPAERDKIIRKWKELKKQNAAPLVEYFSLEEDIFANYRQLMDLYYYESENLTYDPETGETTFTDPEHKMAEQSYRETIGKISELQKHVLSH